MDDPRGRAAAFCERLSLHLPILLAPMAGACPPSSSIAVMRAGGFGACAALLMQSDEMEGWAAEVRANSSGPFQINLWIPEPPPVRDRSHEARVREFLSRWGPPVSEDAGDMVLPNFEEQMPGTAANRASCGLVDYGIVSAAICCRIEVSSNFVVRDRYDGS